MRVFNIANPQQTRKNHNVRQGIPKVILGKNNKKWKQGQKAEWHNIPPEQKLTLILADKHGCQKKN
ncbi:hypothetical protein D3C75_633050 [compost metagenome]